MSLFPLPAGSLGEDLDRVSSILNDAIERAWALTDWEFGFVEDLRQKIIRYGERAMISEKQMEVIERIDAKLKE